MRAYLLVALGVTWSLLTAGEPPFDIRKPEPPPRFRVPGSMFRVGPLREMEHRIMRVFPIR